jgi:serine/threonine-protein phosphatase 2A regulatory subunit B
MTSSCPSVNPTPPLICQKKSCEYKFYTEFQSHEPEFDYLKSLEIEEKINKIRWCKRQNSAHFLLSTNGTSLSDQHRRAWSISYFRVLRWAFVDKTIKLWKVFEKSLRVVSESNLTDGQRALPPPSLRQHLRLPRMQHQDNIIAAVPRKVYSNAHAYHIHSITVNSDQETFISADDLRVNLWNLNISDQSFSSCFFFSYLVTLS